MILSMGFMYLDGKNTNHFKNFAKGGLIVLNLMLIMENIGFD